MSLWLRHADMQTTMAYLRADPTEKIATVAAVVPMPGRRVRLRAPPPRQADRVAPQPLVMRWRLTLRDHIAENIRVVFI